MVGVSSRRWGERPVAVLVPSDPDDPPSLEDVRAFLPDRVARWWLPDAIEIVEEIPTTSVGTLDRKLLRNSTSSLTDRHPRDGGYDLLRWTDRGGWG